MRKQRIILYVVGQGLGSCRFLCPNIAVNFRYATKKEAERIFCVPPSLSIDLKVYSFVGYAAFSVFPLTCAAEKHLVSEKPQNIAVFQGHWGGIGGDRAQSENL